MSTPDAGQSPVRKKLDELQGNVEKAIAANREQLEDALTRIEQARRPLNDKLAQTDDPAEQEQPQQQVDQLDEAWTAANEQLQEFDDDQEPGET